MNYSLDLSNVVGDFINNKNSEISSAVHVDC